MRAVRCEYLSASRRDSCKRCCVAMMRYFCAAGEPAQKAAPGNPAALCGLPQLTSCRHNWRAFAGAGTLKH